MSDIFLFNSLSRKKEKFEPLRPPNVGMYTCGPTVYDFASIGNFRTYFAADTLLRTLKYNGYLVTYVMNITDVGHLTGDNLGDADLGEDRIETSAKREGKTAWDIAKSYEEAFLKDFKRLNLTNPKLFSKATEHIKEQTELVSRLEKGGFTYKTSDGIYFDTVVFEKKTGKKYGELSTLDTIKEGARVEPNPQKRNPRDFALWKFSKKLGERQMEWESPWGIGFPGWHIECSAMSMKYLGESFDIHVGGEDLRQTHHPNEIAQSEAATGKPFVKYWLHATFLKVEGRRMGKSLGNVYTVSDIRKKGYDPLALKYLFLTSHYRDSLNFTWDALSAASSALRKLKDLTISFTSEHQRTFLSPEKDEKLQKYDQDFRSFVNDDLNTPKAIAVMWEMLKSNVPSQDKYEKLLSFDEVLGLGLDMIKQEEIAVPEDVLKLVQERQVLRKEGKFPESDEIRKKIEQKGYKLEDSAQGPKVRLARNGK